MASWTYNAKAESFFKTFKKEEVYLSHYKTFEEAQTNLGAFLDDVYNIKRLHSSLGYLPPMEFETKFKAQFREPIKELKSTCASKS